METKYCKECDRDRPVTEFSKRNGRPCGLRHDCKECHSKKCREWYAKNPGYFRKRNYGMSPEDFYAMLEQQDGLCAICRKPETKTLCVDHDHDTGAIRQLLCQQCNKGLGNFMDDPDLMRKAAEYVERHPSRLDAR